MDILIGSEWSLNVIMKVRESSVGSGLGDTGREFVRLISNKVSDGVEIMNLISLEHKVPPLSYFLRNHLSH